MLAAGSQSHAYAYDQVGNRTTADSVSYTPNALNQYTTVGSESFDYDDNGNLTTDGTSTFTYDLENRLTNFDGTGSSNDTTYEYDAFNRRIRKNVNGTSTFYFYDGDHIIAEYNSGGSVIAEYVHGDQIDETLAMYRSSNVYYYHHDGLGSVTEITSNAGALLESYRYDPYGKILTSLSAIGNPYYFTGREFDPESGIYHYRARQYAPIVGRFFQRDPWGYYDGMNLYQYVYNSPQNWIDPYGLLGQFKIIQLLQNGGMKVIKVVGGKAAAVRARLKGLNVLAPTRQAAGGVEKAAANGKPVIKHPGHNLPIGGQGQPHFQTPGQPGHTFWGGLGPFLLDSLDPFGADAMCDENVDLDGNGIPDCIDDLSPDFCPIE